MRQIVVGVVVVALLVVTLLVVRSFRSDLEQGVGALDASLPAGAESNAAAMSSGLPLPADDAEAASQVPEVLETQSASGVPIRVVRRVRLDAPRAPYGPAYEQLLPLAESGEPAARYRLGLLLYRCRNVPAGPDALTARVEEIHQTRRSEGWEIDDPAQTEESLRQDFTNCRGVPADARGEYRKWMRLAADQGLMEAQLNLMFHLPQAEYCQFLSDCTPEQVRMMDDLREQARRDVTRALDAGSVEAMRTMGGWALNDEMGTPDPVQALAYFSAYDQVRRAAGFDPELEAMLSSLHARLRPIELDEAERRASELLRNPRCCQLTN